MENGRIGSSLTTHLARREDSVKAVDSVHAEVGQCERACEGSTGESEVSIQVPTGMIVPENNHASQQH